MNKYIRYTHGETGLVLGVVADSNEYGEVEVKHVYLETKDITALLSDEVIIDIQLYLETYLCAIE